MVEQTPLFQDGICKEPIVPDKSHPPVGSTFAVADLFGRDSEMKTLQDAFFRACTKGETKSAVPRANNNTRERELVLVSGPSGTGKTALVVRTLKPLVHKDPRQGFFLLGKFDQQERPESFYPVVQAITELIASIRALNDDAMTRKTRDIIRKIALEDRVLIDRVSALEELLEVDDTDSTDQVSDALNKATKGEEKRFGGAHAETRLIYSAERLFRDLARVVGPIVLLLDDLQWSDRPTLNFLASFLEQDPPENILLVGTCRGNEVSIQDELAVMLREVEANGVWVNNIELGNLNCETISNMISSSFGTKGDLSEFLARCIQEKTEGNAFYVVQLIRSLVSKGLLEQDTKNNGIGRVLQTKKIALR